MLICTFCIQSQNTIGTTLDTSQSFDGFTLITPTSDAIPNSTYLINNCGEIINEWLSDFKGQGADLIMEDGSLFRGAFDNMSTLNIPGNNGRLEHFDWDGSLIWGYTFSDTDFSFHHDYFPLSNGNILMIVTERMTQAEAIQAGRDPALISQGDIYTEKIVEVEPVGSNDINIVWEWNLWDHLIQDFDNTKDNFGVVGDNPQLLDINFIGFSNGDPNWLHTNSMHYNEDLDQVLLNSRLLGQFFIIDHSTTTAEAATNSGGNSGRGGDFLYRWGNPQSYDQGDAADQKLFGAHSIHWIEEGLPDAGKLMLFNNGLTRNFTTIEVITPPAIDGNGNYDYTPGTAYGPANGDIRYQAPVPTDFFAPFLSSAYQLENGNILIDNGPVGQLFEVNEAGDIVWEYVSPVLLDGTILSQEDPPGDINSRFFRARRYAPDYAGFDGRDLSPGLPIEMNPIFENCELLSIDEIQVNNLVTLEATYIEEDISIRTKLDSFELAIFNMEGQILHKSNSEKTVDVSHLPSGLYFVRIDIDGSSLVEKIIKK